MSLNHTFRHQCKNGQRLELTVDLSERLPKFTTNVDMKNQSDEIKKEYLAWSRGIATDVLDLLTPEQFEAVAIKGMTAI